MPLCCSTGSQKRLRSAKTQITISVVALTSALVPTRAVGAVERLAAAPASEATMTAAVACRAEGSTTRPPLQRGRALFQQQNCHGCHGEMSSPVVFPPVATSNAPLTWAQRDEARRSRPSPRTSMPHNAVDAPCRPPRHDIQPTARAPAGQFLCNKLLPSPRSLRNLAVFARGSALPCDIAHNQALTALADSPATTLLSPFFH